MSDQKQGVSWPILGAGIVLASYGAFFLADLGAIGYGVIGVGAVVAVAGRRLQRWAKRAAERLQPEADVGPDEALGKHRRRFAWSVCSMAALGAFSLWRVQMTVWRPAEERLYLFPVDTWIGRLEHSWFNDALYAFGMVGLLYVIYTGKEFLASFFESEPSSLAAAEGRSGPSWDQWEEHQDRSKLMIGTGIVIVLLWAWLEEIADLVPGYVFDKWDVNAIYVGFILGYSVMTRLSYPVFACSPAFPSSIRRHRNWLGDLVRLVYAGFVWIYTAATDPLTSADRWSHLAELSALILGSMWLIDARRWRRDAD